MTLADFTIPLGLGLVSSLHCVGMCGPLVLAWSLPLRREGRNMLAAHAGYHAGRIVTYSLMGAAAGTLLSIGHLAGIEKAATIALGAFTLLAGLLMFGLLPASKLIQIGAVPPLFSRITANLLRSGKTLPLGFALGFLPCGLVYVALLKAASAGNPLDGAVNMFAFGLGTTPALLGIGSMTSFIPARLLRHSSLVAAISITILGGYMIWRGIMVPLPAAGSCHHGI